MQYVVLSILLVVTAQISSTDGQNYGYTKTLKNIFDKYQQSNSSRYLKELLKNIDLDSIIDSIPSSSLQNFSNSTQKCVGAYKGLNKNELLTSLDADGKPGAGLLQGGKTWLGSYQECMSMTNLHYCTFGKLYIPKFKQFATLGLCVPESCSIEDIVSVLNYTSNFLWSKGLHLFLIQDNMASMTTYNADSVCYDKDTSYSSGAIVMMIISAIIGLLCLIGSIVDQADKYIKQSKSNPYVLYVEDDKLAVIDDEEIGNEKKQGKDGPVSMHQVKVEKGHFLSRFLLCFSLIKNTRALFDTNVPPGAITSVNGIRTLSIMWVMLGHTLAFGLTAFDNPATLFQWIPRFTMQGILNATVSVDTFFILSGLLVGYLSMKRYQTTGSLPLLRYYLHRYIRLTPSYAYMIFFLTYLYPILADGPLWFTQGTESVATSNCESYWWTNLLYINNLYPTSMDKMCFAWSWYLANDMQFYVISPIILYIMYRLKWLGVLIGTGVPLLVCFIVNGVEIHTKNATPILSNIFLSPSPVMRYMTSMYEKPWIRIAPYLVGLILGYILNKDSKGYEGKGKYMFYGVGWVMAVGLGIAVVYGPYSAVENSWKEPTTIIYNIFFRFVWAIAVGWVVYAGHHGYGGLVNDIMSWKAFIPLSRLTYATYLVHPMVIDLFYFSQQVPIHLTELNLAFLYVSTMAISFTLAYVTAVCIEYPVFNLEKLLLKF